MSLALTHGLSPLLSRSGATARRLNGRRQAGRAAAVVTAKKGASELAPDGKLAAKQATSTGKEARPSLIPTVSPMRSAVVGISGG
jgi:hypothetical protein